jgi:hypothetical protein
VHLQGVGGRDQVKKKRKKERKKERLKGFFLRK